MPHYRWNRQPKKVYLTELDKHDQKLQAKEYQDKLLAPDNEHVTKYYNDIANGYEPNISLYIKNRT